MALSIYSIHLCAYTPLGGKEENTHFPLRPRKLDLNVGRDKKNEVEEKK